VKRIPQAESRFPVVFSDPEEARQYAARHAGLARKMADRFVKRLRALGFEQGRILDAGAGPGDGALRLAAAFPDAKVVGLDLSDPFLTMARESAGRQGVAARISFVKGDVQSMPLEDDSFDAVVSLDTLHVVDDPVAMLNECERILKPDGILMVVDVRRSFLGWLDPIFHTGYTAAEVRRLAARSDLRPCKVSSGLMFLHVEAGGG
jgi:ubiquinone/menaquinone biosynthesis C-methylase UbiE